MGPKPLKISSRGLHELLAGKMTLARFMDAHGWDESVRGSHPNPFERALSEGRMISAISVEQVNENDDDWLSIEFGSPDPAISPFRILDRKEE